MSIASQLFHDAVSAFCGFPRLRKGARVELLVAVRNDAKWHAGTVTESRGERLDVMLDNGRFFVNVHVDSTRAIVTEPSNG